MLTPYAVRHAVDGDRNFVVDSWRRSLQDAPAYAAIPTRGYVAWITEIIKGFVGEGSALSLADTDRLYVARDNVRPTYLYGWLLARDLKPGFALVYAFVKRGERRAGIAKALMVEALEHASDGPLTYAFRTRFDPWFHELGLTFSPVEQLLFGRKAS